MKILDQATGGIAGAIVDVLKGLGIVKDPEQEARARAQLEEAEARRAQTLVDFVRATSPAPERVYVWANTVIALIRPAVTILLVYAIITNPAGKIDLTDARTWPVLWWFFGAELLRFIGLRAANGNGKGILRGGSAHLEQATPPAIRGQEERGPRGGRFDP